MKIKVNGNNERIFTPDLFGNLEQPKKEQFGIKVKKLSLAVHSDKWIKGNMIGSDTDISIDLKKYIRAHVVDFINPFTLQDEEKEIVLDLELLFSDSYAELYPIIEGLLSYIQDMYSEDKEDDVKK